MREYVVTITVRVRVAAHDAQDAADRAWDDMTDLGHDVVSVDPGCVV